MVVKGEVGALFLLLAPMVLVCGSLLVVVGLLLFITSNLRLGPSLLLDFGRIFGVGTLLCVCSIQDFFL